MQNFEFEHNGEFLWYSRSLSVCGVIYYMSTDGLVYILANKRGPECEFNKGLWNLPGGFIDFNETAEQAVCRETLEETGVIIEPDQCSLIQLYTEPVGKRQTMVARYLVPLNEDVKYDNNFDFSDIERQTNGEVEDIRWICIKDLDKYNWVRGQKELIKDLIFGL